MNSKMNNISNQEFCDIAQLVLDFINENEISSLDILEEKKGIIYPVETSIGDYIEIQQEEMEDSSMAFSVAYKRPNLEKPIIALVFNSQAEKMACRIMGDLDPHADLNYTFLGLDSNQDMNSCYVKITNPIDFKGMKQEVQILTTKEAYDSFNE